MSQTGRTYKFFLKTYPGSTLAVIGLLILAGLAEAVGIVAFLPLLQLVMEGQTAGTPTVLGDAMAKVGVPMNIFTVGGFIILAIGSKATILWLAMRHVSFTVARISADLRQRLMGALLKANWRYFVHHTMGSTLNAVVMETFRSSMAFISATRLISFSVQFLVYATGALLLSWQAFAGGIVMGFMLVAALWSLVRVARKAGMRQTVIAKNLMTQMADMLQGIKPLRAMALEGKFLESLGNESRSLEKAQADQLASSQAMRIFHEPLMVVAAVCGLVLAVHFTAMEASQIALMGILFIRLLTAMNNTQGEYQRLVIQESALFSLLDSIDEAEKAADNWPGHDAIPGAVETIAFRDVSFAHGERALLSHVSLNFPARSLTALVGPSGSGKTTVLDLLSGFYRPVSGNIFINDCALSSIDLDAWRRAVGFVPQEVFLFNDTIFENIVMGRRDLSEEAVWAAIDAAGAHDFISSLPQKIHAPVGENGRMLSGGQRQRIAIARAIVHRPQVLILDEATSAVDQETEVILLDTLRNLAKEMTVVFVSHNKAVLAYADHVYEIRDGQILRADRNAA